MRGSEKQIKWAEKIITNAEKSWNDLKAEVNPGAWEQFDNMKKDFFERMKSDQAEVIINNRFNFPEDSKMLKNNMAYFSKVKI